MYVWWWATLFSVIFRLSAFDPSSSFFICSFFLHYAIFLQWSLEELLSLGLSFSFSGWFPTQPYCTSLLFWMSSFFHCRISTLVPNPWSCYFSIYFQQRILACASPISICFPWYIFVSTGESRFFFLLF